MNTVEYFEAALTEYVQGNDELMYAFFTPRKFKDSPGSPRYKKAYEEYLKIAAIETPAMMRCLSTPHRLTNDLTPFSYLFSEQNNLKNDPELCERIFRKLDNVHYARGDKETSLLFQLNKHGQPLIEQMSFLQDPAGLGQLQCVFAENYLKQSHSVDQYKSFLDYFVKNVFSKIAEQPANSRHSFYNLISAFHGIKSSDQLVKSVEQYAEKISDDKRSVNFTPLSGPYMAIPFYIKQSSVFSQFAEESAQVLRKLTVAYVNILAKNGAFTDVDREEIPCYTKLATTAKNSQLTLLDLSSDSTTHLPPLIERTFIYFTKNEYAKNTISNERQMLNETIDGVEQDKQQNYKTTKL